MELLQTEGYKVKAVKETQHSEGRLLSGVLYKGSVKIATFEDDGRGAPMQIWYTEADRDGDFLSASKMILDEGYAESDAILIEDMANEFMLRKDVMAARKRATFFTRAGDEECVIYKIDYPYSEKIVNMLLENDNPETFLNEMFDIYPDGVEKVYRGDS
jgi:hypothetical protein